MRNLSLSLIAVVILSIVGLGWITNMIYAHKTNLETETPEFDIHLSYTQELARMIEKLDDAENFIASWNQETAYPITLLERDNFPIPDTLSQNFERGEVIVLESDPDIAAYYLLSDKNRIVSITLPRSAKTKNKETLKFILTLGFYGGITTIVLIWIWPLIHHLRGLREVARRFGRGDLNTRAKINTFSYIRDIEMEFNNMADRIQSLIRDNKLLSRAASHDLKTPLARLRFGLDALTETDNEALREKYANRVNQDLEAMESLIDTLLQYARLDESSITLNKQSVDLNEILSSLISAHEHDAIRVHFDNKTKDCTLETDPRYFAMLINNVLSNAVRHAREQVLLTLIQTEQNIQIIIEDDGEGIPYEQRDNAVKPFWRGSQSRNKSGHGMGLAIVARIIEWHAANLIIGQSSALGGAHISLIFSHK